MSELSAATEDVHAPSGHETTVLPEPPADERDVSSPGPRRRPRWVIPVTALVAGVAVGAVIAGVSVAAAKDPLKSPEYHALQGELSSAQAEMSGAQDQARRANNSATAASSSAASVVAAASSSAAQRAAQLDQRERAVAARESAISAAEQHIRDTSIGDGTWTVGTDVEAGTYKTSAAVSGHCYWGIYRSGTNGGDIIDNDIVTGGYPTVTLRAGEDFKNNGCGTFVKQ